MHKLISFISFLLLGCLLFAQNDNPMVKVIECSRIIKSGDVEHAISVGKVNRIFLKCSPKGAGEKIEVASGKAKDKFYFEKEHNTVWFKFRVPFSSEMTFTIKPKNPENDYDFLLFKNEGENTVKNITNKRLKPIRSNLSRFNPEVKSFTGLSFDGKQTHVPSGVQFEFSSPLKVEKDEEYYLAIDNVYDDGQGAVIDFEFYETKKISGYVSNDKQDKKIGADVSWDDAETGETLKTTKADPKTGYFEMEVPFVVNNPEKIYILAVDAEEYFFDEKMISVDELKKIDPKPLKIALTQLKKGNKLKINNIHFQGGLPAFIKSSMPSLKRLKKLMTKNKTLKILVEGHTNGCDVGINSQILSERRALRVKKYLFENGIDESRVQTIGYGCKKMLFPVTGTKEQQQQNRRVEILVTEY